MSCDPVPAASVSYGPFSYDADGFNVDGILRVGWPSLYEMLFPHELSGVRAQKRARDRAELTITYPWLIAQMTFYGLSFNPKDTVAKLSGLLADNVKDGNVSSPWIRRIYPLLIAVSQCKKLPFRVNAIQSDLEQMFKAANPASARVEQRKAEPVAKTPRKPSAQQPRSLLSEDKHKRALEKYKRPVDLANYDCKVFLAKYFLNENGKPDRSKTLFPLLLPGLADKLSLQQAADGIFGLKTSIGGEGEFRVLVIGWNRAAIFEISEQMSIDQARLREDMSPTWHEHLRRYYSMIKKLPVLNKYMTLKEESTRGTYAVECRGASDNWFQYKEDSSLRITYNKEEGWVGIFDIGVLYGVMQLGTDRKALLARCKAIEKDEARSDSDTETDKSFEATEDEADSSEKGDVFSDLSEGEQDEERIGDDSGGFTVLPRKRTNAQTKAHVSAAKRLKASRSTSSNRLYFKWRGREQGEGDVAYDFHKNNTGYLQFTDAQCTKFESTISNDLIGKNVLFQGFKISNDGGAVTRTYREYSTRAGNIFDDQ